MDELKRLGKKLSQCRVGAGLTQERIAELAGITLRFYQPRPGIREKSAIVPDASPARTRVQNQNLGSTHPQREVPLFFLDKAPYIDFVAMIVCHPPGWLENKLSVMDKRGDNGGGLSNQTAPFLLAGIFRARSAARFYPRSAGDRWGLGSTPSCPRSFSRRPRIERGPR